MRRALAGALACALALDTAACGSSKHSPHSSRAMVSAIYAGSLVELMEHRIAPAFERRSGYVLEGFGGGSTEDASEIKGRVREADVFVSASASADKLLEGPANGGWVSWYATFARSPLELGYDPATSFGRQLAAGKPWYEVLTEKGIRVGRTDPKLDPKGVLTVQAIDEAASSLHDEALRHALASFPVYPETALVGRLQSGQLDAGFFYAVESAAAHFPTVGLQPVKKSALYTVTTLNHNANAKGAAALVSYMLSAAGQQALRANGLEPLSPPQLSGSPGAVPASLRSALGAG